MNRYLLHLISLIAYLLFLTACTSPPVNQSPAIEERTGTDIPVENSPAAKAAREYARGDYSTAASQFEQLGNEVGSEESRQGYLLRAADAYARMGGPADQASQGQLKKLNTDLLSAEQRLQYKIVQAQLAINQARARDAFALVPREAANASLETQIRLGMLRSDAWLGLQRPTEAVLERIDIDALISHPEERTLNHQWIWNQLQNMSTDDVFSPPTGMSQNDAGWWSLAAIVKKAGRTNDSYDQNELTIWKSTYPGHPATEDILFFIEGNTASVVQKTSPNYTGGQALEGTPRNVALLLPLSGQYASAGQMILNGFRQAAETTTSTRVNFQVYDAADKSHSLAEVALHAVANGAEMLVGPLQKSAILELVSVGDLYAPILALNTLPEAEGGYEGLFQFGLNPENEAVELAKRALADGHYRSVVLASADSKGERIANAFIQAFEQGGGRIIGYKSFQPKSNTISQVVKQLLRAETNDPLWEDVRKGTSRTSNDQQQIDMFFFSASTRDSRVIRPIVQLHRAFDLPVYSSARVYSQPDVNMDGDLDGLVFCDMPSRIAGNIAATKLSALGEDAYLLVNQLEYLSNQSGAELPAKTGRLSITPRGQIWRHLDCAVFNKGVPKRLP